MNDAPALEVEALRYAWPRAGRDCLAIDTLRFPRAGSTFVQGPSGCGKSTLLALLAGVLLPSGGRVSLLGTPWGSLSGARRDARRADHVGYIFQQFNLLPWLDALGNVLLPCRFSALRRRRAAEREGSAERAARALLGRVALDERDWHRPASRLSVGQQQRVAAARALIGDPEVVIADEPTSALDTPLRDAFVTLLLDACRDRGSALVFVSHDERLAARFERHLSLPEVNQA